MGIAHEGYCPITGFPIPNGGTREHALSTLELFKDNDPPKATQWASRIGEFPLKAWCDDVSELVAIGTNGFVSVNFKRLADGFLDVVGLEHIDLTYPHPFYWIMHDECGVWYVVTARRILTACVNAMAEPPPSFLTACVNAIAEPRRSVRQRTASVAMLVAAYWMVHAAPPAKRILPWLTDPQDTYYFWHEVLEHDKLSLASPGHDFSHFLSRVMRYFIPSQYSYYSYCRSPSHGEQDPHLETSP